MQPVPSPVETKLIFFYTKSREHLKTVLEYKFLFWSLGSLSPVTPPSLPLPPPRSLYLVCECVRRWVGGVADEGGGGVFDLFMLTGGGECL